MRDENADVQYFLGVDIGGTKIAFSLVDTAGNEIERLRIPTPDAETIIREIALFVAQTQVSITAIGIGTTGVVDPSTGAIRAASNAIAGWNGFELKARVESATGIPTAVENDVNAFVLGEFVANDAIQNSVIGIMLGTGVGGAVILDGELVRGREGAAGELGHMPGFGHEPCTCGGHGHLETIASGRGIATHYAQLSGHPRSTAEIAALAKHGDEHASKVFFDAGYQVGIAMTVAASLLDITTILIGGGVIQAWELLAPGWEAAMKQHPLVSGEKIHVIPAQLGDSAVIRGALCSARQLAKQG